ncbi:ammonium transporter [Limnobacter alexandrii]|jgi:ammonium transporter, Amt family|uniref:ammonium transporter n=1 Tax=Limnobacter alexandrii TaxID=2570352 RepID=UPI001108D6D9|nr:ammonium transporter [Limnobacter alexandrii]
MKKLLTVWLAAAALSFSVASPGVFAQETPAAPATEATETMPVASDATAPAAEAPMAAEAAPAEEAAAEVVETVNKGDITWMMVATALVIFMTVPGLALFYGGLVRSKNMLSVLMQVFTVFCLIVVLWSIYGYSLAFGGGDNPFVGNFSKLFLSGVTPDSLSATFTEGVMIPEFIFIAFQSTFAAITCCLIVGAFAERIKFSAVLLFCAIWFTFSYIPIAHMVWDAAGFIFADGAIDFAGGTVVHINAAVAGLVGAYMVGKRVGYGKEAMPPHNLALTMVGASMLWVGWFGFNAGSNLEANGGTTLAFINTILATAAATLSWAAAEALLKGKASMLGGASGAVAGLVAITPACGTVGPMGALILGLLAGPICLWGVSGLKKMLGADDSLDVFGLHGVAGILGALMVGVLSAPSLGGTMGDDFVIASQLAVQAKGVVITIVWSGIVAAIAFKLVDLIVGLRVSEDAEREGLDITSHGETAYSK